jgi:hypothetical protein
MDDKVRFQNLIQEMDSAIKQGNIRHAKGQLNAINFRKAPREHWVPLSNLARRCQMPGLIMKWLNPIIRPLKPNNIIPTPSELALYGNALTRIGSFIESKEVLDSIDPIKDEQIYFYRALLAIQQWQYADAIPNLESYIKQTNVSSYQKLVGSLNLAASLTALGDFKSSTFYLGEILNLSEENKLIKSNALEIQAQNYFYAGNLKAAKQSLNDSLALTSDSSQFYSVFKKKWLFVIELFEDKSKKTNQAKIDNFKEYCRKEQDWESLRDIDFFLAMKTRDEFRFLNVYYGTSLPGYKEQLRRRYQYDFDLPDDFGVVWSEYFDQPIHDWPRFDLASCTFGQKQDQVSTPKLRELFRFLISDIYRPFSFGEVLNHIYPDEYYNIVSSPAKLNRLIQRLRYEISEMGMPLNLEVSHNKLKFVPLAPILFLSCEKRNIKPLEDSLFDEYKKLLNHFGARSFTAIEAGVVLKTSQRSARRALNGLTKVDKLKVNKFGVKTTYLLNIVPAKKIA